MTANEAERRDSSDLADGLVRYMQTHPQFDAWDAERAIREVANLLTGDIGVAQAVVYAIGLDIDLYTTDLLRPATNGRPS